MRTDIFNRSPTSTIVSTLLNQEHSTLSILASYQAALQPHGGRTIFEICTGRRGGTISGCTARLTERRLLRTGGWVQITEWDLIFRSDSGQSDALQALREWNGLYTLSLSQTARPEGRKSSRPTQDIETWMRMAGFVNVSADVRDVPTCSWHTGMSPGLSSFGR